MPIQFHAIPELVADDIGRYLRDSPAVYVTPTSRTVSPEWVFHAMKHLSNNPLSETANHNLMRYYRQRVRMANIT